MTQLKTFFTSKRYFSDVKELKRLAEQTTTKFYSVCMHVKELKSKRDDVIECQQIAIDINGSRREKTKGRSKKGLPQFFSFLPQDLVMIFQSLVMILPRLSTLKHHNLVSGQTLKTLIVSVRT